MKKLKLLLKSQNPFGDIKAYLLGNWRYWLWYTKYGKIFIRPHIREQIELRTTKWMDKDCFNNGTCKMCGCVTTALQMANKACDKPCYPTIMNKQDWKDFKAGWMHIDNEVYWQMKENLTLTII